MLYKYFIKIGINTLLDLLTVSVNQSSKAKSIIEILVFVLKRLLDVMTDDNKDNTSQIELILLQELPEHVQALNTSLEQLKEQIVIDASNSIIV